MEEGKSIEYKLTLDSKSEKEKVELVKLVISLANSGGGKIIIGKDHLRAPGVEQEVLDAFDSAKCDDLVNKYSETQLHITHKIDPAENGRYLYTLEIPASANPIAMSREGSWSGFDSQKEKPLFYKGDIWVRHSSKNEKISNHDVRDWAEKIRKEERDRILGVISSLYAMPEGSKVEIVSASGKAIETPKDLLQNACFRRQRDPSHLLTANDLLWVFQQRQSLGFDSKEISILIASALRRNPTLYWWLTQIEDESEILIKELNGAITASDRDKSDAARSVIELAAVYANEGTIREILNALRNSRYSHFREESENWSSRRSMKSEILSRIRRAKLNRRPLLDFELAELEWVATSKAKEMFSTSIQASSTILGNVNRVIWYKRKGHLLDRE